jgi:hypothetical protein
MSSWRRFALPLLFGLAASLARAQPAAPDEGRDLYEGRHPALAMTSLRDDAASVVPREQAACSACHRPSGLGSFEGGSEVPPISAGTLARPFVPATTRRYAPAPVLRVRPAYDAMALHRLLTEGITADGRQLGTLMPRYRLEPAHSASLLEHLNRLGTDPTPGVADDVVHFATITSDEVPASRVRDLVRLLEAFFIQKNALTRAEDQRRLAARRTEHTMYSRYRRWVLHHWVLHGPAASWPEQLAAAYRLQPVFAVLSGLSTRDWSPVHRFCEGERLPCLFPIVDWPVLEPGFYSAYFGGAAPAQAQWLAASAAPAPDVRWLVLVDGSAEGAAAGERLAAELRRAGRMVTLGERWADEAAVLSALPPLQVAERLRGGAPRQVFLLAGAAAPSDAAHASWPAGTEVSWVTQQQSAAPALARARAWWRARGIRPADENEAALVLLAASAAVESLVHVDERFSREYCLEKLEHNLENMPPLTAYPRLSLGPGQRLAARSVWLQPLR